MCAVLLTKTGVGLMAQRRLTVHRILALLCMLSLVTLTTTMLFTKMFTFRVQASSAVSEPGHAITIAFLVALILVSPGLPLFGRCYIRMVHAQQIYFKLDMLEDKLDIIL